MFSSTMRRGSFSSPKLCNSQNMEPLVPALDSEYKNVATESTNPGINIRLVEKIRANMN